MSTPSRREFMRMSAFGAVGLTFLSNIRAAETRRVKIERIECFPVRYPTVMRFRFFEGPVSGSGRPAVLIKVTADDGTVGWGESVPIPRWSYETLEGAFIALEHYIKPMLLGRNPFDLHEIHRDMNREIANGWTTGSPITKAGIDIALHDLIGKLTGRNIAELWGRKTGDDILLSWTLNPVELDDLGGLIAGGRERGYSHYNVKVAPNLDFDVEMCRIVRELVPDGFLWADANGHYDLPTALEAVRKLADLGVPVLEQPIAINHISGYQRLRKLNALPIVVDEGMVSPVEVLEYIKLGCCDGVAMKPARCGGLVSSVQQIEILENANLMFLGSGLTDPDVSLAASLILYGAFGLRYPAALNGPQFLGESVLKKPFRAVNGRVPVPKGPGLGIDVDEEKVRDLSARTGRLAGS
jgi:L-alanine-DL-glutamate epimerase-like enolase superfamily enzyme